MAAANPTPGALVVEDHSSLDPFSAHSHDPHRQRYSAFDDAQFSLYLNGSPVQAKRALEAHLAETTRRLQETSHLGNALVQQRKELEERLTEVVQQQGEDDIGPDLRQRLAELEKEFNEVGRETARAFLPKSRVPSGETDATGGSVYSSESMQSPSKVSVPSRKQRNHQPSRINDIALATEISTSLLSQLKELQAVLLQKDEQLKAVELDRSQLEIEVEGLSQRLRTLDESDSRLKDVNWSLETQVREFEAMSKSAADKEHRLNNTLNQAKSEKSALEREYEELKGMYAKLNDDHINKTKQHETELSGLRRNVAMGESERSALQRKLEDLANQNHELAKAVAYRMKADENNANGDSSGDDVNEGDEPSPDHSPPISPNKGTPRHGQLESETLKHSLQHAHRMIQQLKNNIHREKTEKIELKRMLQDARDEIETNRTAANLPGNASKRKKTEKEVFKKPARPDRLGALRRGTEEIVMEDDDWEEQDIVPSPSKPSKPTTSIPVVFTSDHSSPADSSAYEGFETANETTDAAFETANELDGTTTETDAFQTGAETPGGSSSDDMTETETGTVYGSSRRSVSPLMRKSPSHRDMYESTASNSGDDYDERELKTPRHRRRSSYRFQGRPGSSRRSPARGGLDSFASTPPAVRDSPNSYTSNSNNSTPAQGKSLFAELNGLSGDDTDSAAEGTPGRSSVVSTDSPERTILGRSPLQRSILGSTMVDSSTMTDPVLPEPVDMSSIYAQHTQPQAAIPADLSLSSLFVQNTSPQTPSQPQLKLSSFSSHDTVPKPASLPVLELSDVSAHATAPQPAHIPSLAMSSVVIQDTLPQSPPAPMLNLSTVSAHGTSPQSPPAPVFDFSTLSAHGTSPVSPPPATFALSAVAAHDTSPQSPPAPVFDMSTVSGHETLPREIPAPFLGMSSFSSHTTEPQDVRVPSLNMSTVSSHGTDPVSPVVEKVLPPSFNLSSITHQTTEPREGHGLKGVAPVALLASGISSQMTEPRMAQEDSSSMQNTRGISSNVSDGSRNANNSRQGVDQVPLQMSSVSAHSTAPTDVPRPTPSTLSAMSSQVTEPYAVNQILPQLSALSSQTTEPYAAKPTPSRLSMLSSQATVPVVPKLVVPQLSMHASQSTEPSVPKQTIHQLSMHASESTDPVAVRQQPLQISAPSSESTEPVVPKMAPWKLSPLFIQTSEPLDAPRPARPTLSVTSAQTTEPVQPMETTPSALSQFAYQTTEPVQPQGQAPFKLSAVSAQHTEPSQSAAALLSVHGSSEEKSIRDDDQESPTVPAFLPTPNRPSSSNRANAPALILSPIFTQATEPYTPSRPVTAHRREPTSPTLGFFDSASARSKDKEVESQGTSANDRAPLASVNGVVSQKSPRTPMSDGGTQTMVSAEQIDKLLLARSQRYSALFGTAELDNSPLPPGSPSRRYSNELGRTSRRPNSSGSTRSRAATPPPLPANHKEVIATLKNSLPPTSSGSMGPPARPASAYKKPSTPSLKTSNSGLTPKTNITTPRAHRRSEGRSGASSPISRRSSLSSFSSELDQRFNVAGGPSFATPGMPAGTTDPRMIQAITQTMIGEYLWKYTRKAGREDMSEKRHRRFFWIHPYTRTLYWSDTDPQTAGKVELKAKSVAIETVQEVDDLNPSPPGLHQKSLLVGTPGRFMKFTATTAQRHTTWYGALNYLCQRVENEQAETKSTNSEIQTEFNGGYRSSSRQTARSRMSISSYANRQTSSPGHSEIPTLRQSHVTPQRPSSTEPGQGTLSSRFSSLLRPTSAMRGSFASRRSRASVLDASTFEEPSSSHLELGRDIHEHVERDVDGMVNVRACCDGKYRHLD
jgi:hypothetical protein